MTNRKKSDIAFVINVVMFITAIFLLMRSEKDGYTTYMIAWGILTLTIIPSACMIVYERRATKEELKKKLNTHK
jgi:hypothetical protein